MARAIAASLVVSSLSAGAAAAPTPEAMACASAYEQTQILQKEGKFIAAGQTAATCTQPVCGAFIAKECGKFFDEITLATPSVVLAATDPKGNDLAGAHVTIDGVPRDRMDGAEIPIDPGTHVFHFEAPGVPPEEKTYTLRAGEKLRRVSAVMGVDTTPPSASPPKQPSLMEADKQHLLAEPPPSPSVSARTLRIGAGLVGAVGVLGVGGFGLLRWSAANEYNSMLATCRNQCVPSDVDSLRQKFIYSDVLLGVGIAGIAVGGVLLAVSLGRHDGPELRVAPTASGGLAQFTTRF